MKTGRHNTIVGILFTAVFFATAVVACQPTQTGNQSNDLAIDTTSMRNGDILFRRGSGLESNIVVSASGGIYSHAALACHNGTQWLALHAVPQESNGEPEYLKSEPITDFFRSNRAIRGAMARVDCSDSIAQSAAEYALQKITQRTLFDNLYDIDDTTHIYCTELIYRAYMPHNINFRNRETDKHYNRCIFPKDILESEYIKSVTTFKTTL